MISKEQLQDFKSLYKEHFGKDISDADALESATKLIDMLRVVYKPMTKGEFDELAKKSPSKPLEPAQ